LDPLGGNNETKKFDLGFVEFAFLSIGEEVGLKKMLEDLTNEFVVGLEYRISSR
jgi:uncharacterized protein YihD (DUF1040 family)